MLKDSDRDNFRIDYEIGTNNRKHLRRQQALRRRLGDDFYLSPKETKIELPEMEDLVPYKDNDIEK